MISLFASWLLLSPAPRDHGPGTSGGGLTTVSGETLKASQVMLTWRQDYTQYERLSATDIERRTMKMTGDHVHFDALRWSLLQTVELGYGLSDDLQIGFSFGYYKGNGLREGHLDPGPTYESHENGDVTGMTDPWVTLKGRLYRGESGHLSILAGIKFPYGDDDEVGENSNSNAPLEPSLQPGSGRFDFMLGAAYSTYLSAQVTFDTSLAYTYRTEEEEYKIGDQVLYGAALAYRFTENARDFPAFSAFLEMNVRWLGRNTEDGEHVHNSGGTTVFLSPGVRIAFTERAAFTLAVQLPVIQELHEEQQEVDFKVSAGLALTF